jgi:hopanoid-associated phosphorylase
MILAVCGLLREARLLSRYGLKVVIGNAIEAAITPDTRGIISVGIAGALAPDLETGDAVIAERVVTACDAFETDAKWTARLAARLPDATIGAILGRNTIADDAEVKALLHESSRAVAVDMESHIAARTAHARGLPFAALRVISDRADQSLPPAVQVAMRPDGSIALGRVLWSVAKGPGQIPALIRTGRESEKAFAALLRCLDLLGLGLRGPDGA